MPDFQINEIIEEDVGLICSANIPWYRLREKTVLISGANGYVPAYFVYTLLRYNDKKNLGIKLIALCRNKQKAEKRFAAYINRTDFTLIIQDICEPIRIQEEIHYFIHAASPASVSERHIDPLSTFNANAIGAQNMLDCACTKHCEGFLLLSSVDVYGQMPNAERLTEERQGFIDTQNIRNAYALGKRTAEFLCAAYYAKFAVPAVIVRPGQIIGPGIDISDGRLHIDFVSQMLSSNEIVLKSDGSAKRTFLYISDAITGMLFALFSGKPGEAYNVADEKGEMTVLELAETMAASVTDRRVSVVFDYEKRNSIEVTSALSSVIASSDKLRGLGWTPKTNIKYGLKRMIGYYGLN